jgi:hypothetical protein
MRRLINFLIFAGVSTVATKAATVTMSSAWSSLRGENDETPTPDP